MIETLANLFDIYQKVVSEAPLGKQKGVRIKTEKEMRKLVRNNPLSQSFDCKKCHSTCKAECCGPIPMGNDFIEKHKNKIQTVPTQFYPIDNFTSIPMTSSLKCIFLKDDYGCAIYEDRPPVCQLFGTEIVKEMSCAYQDKDGNIR